MSAREAGHIRFFDLAFSGRTDAAIDALYAHLAEYPRDALMIAAAANPNGVIGGSGRVGQKQRIAALLDSLAPHYGDDYWFLSYHAIALSEDGRIDAARPKIERSVTLNRKNAHCAHGVAHVCYESGDADAGRDFLSSWLADLSPRRRVSRPSELASRALRAWRGPIGRRRSNCTGTPSRSTGTAAGRSRR